MEDLSLTDTVSAYHGLLASIDGWFSRCAEIAGNEMACHRGCSECCRGLFDITLLDAFVLKQGFDLLPEEVRRTALARVEERVRGMRLSWPEFSHPYVLNVRPEVDWEELMPDEDETPCPLLENGSCLVYSHRPMTCRLHGLPLIDLSGEVMHDEWCTLNFTSSNPLVRPELRNNFGDLFRDEVSLLRAFTSRLLNRSLSEVDTFIPTALLIDFDRFDWRGWAVSTPLVLNDPC